jgi:multiple sugar transport system permease protein
MRRLGLLLAGAAILTFLLGPVVWQALTSLRPEAAMGTGESLPFTLDAWRALFEREDFLWSLFNSIAVAAVTTLYCLTVGASAAFALARLRFPGRGLLLAASLAITTFPPIAIVSPLYLTLRWLGLLDTRMGLVLPYATFALPLTLWLLTSFFRQIPVALYQAARVDGCTPFLAFRRVILPLAGPGLTTTGLLVFVFAWTEFLFALSFLSTPSKRTVPVAISLFAAEHAEPWAEIAAASILATLPLVILTLIFQRRIVSGLTAGAMKG